MGPCWRKWVHGSWVLGVLIARLSPSCLSFASCSSKMQGIPMAHSCHHAFLCMANGVPSNHEPKEDSSSLKSLLVRCLITARKNNNSCWIRLDSIYLKMVSEMQSSFPYLCSPSSLQHYPSLNQNKKRASFPSCPS